MVKLTKFFFIIIIIISCNNELPETQTENIQIPENKLPEKDEPLNIFLTWTKDPTKSMTLDWHTFNDQPIFYKHKMDKKWLEVEGEQIPFYASNRIIHRVTLENLLPNEIYEFTFGLNNKRYYFKTMPNSSENNPIKVAIGGDTMHNSEMFRKMNELAKKTNPDFVVFGGDIAYADGLESNINRWYSWLDIVNSSLIQDDNRVIPIVVAIGNHEVKGHFYRSHPGYEANDKEREKIAPFFYNIFAFPGHPGYKVLDFGNYLSLFVLDSDHSNRVEGEQTIWLENQLKLRNEIFFKIPVYHVPAYPSVRDFNGTTSKNIRENWVPLFEKYNVKLAFENHDHTYKRTFKLKNNKIDDDGIQYIGDGAWGVNTREPEISEDKWYINKATAKRHFILLKISGMNYDLKVFEENGVLIDKESNGKLIISDFWYNHLKTNTRTLLGEIENLF
jgi:acid phosphatase type 7